MRIVLDTNVLVSGLLSPFGPPGQIVALVASGDLQLCFDVRIMLEYREVLLRPAFGFDPTHVHILVDHVEDEGLEVTAQPLAAGLPDPADEAFLAVAIASSASVLVTGNLRHFPVDLREGAVVLSPADFLRLYHELTAGA